MGRLKLVAILNPASGADEPVLATLSDVLGAAGADWEARVTTGPGDAERFARDAREAGVDRVLAYGGDGTVSAVATGLAGGDTALAILCGGTGNAFAQELGVPRDLAAALELAVSPDARVEPVDCLRVGERRLLLRVGIGADAGMIAGADREAKDRLGWLAYLVSGFGQMRNREPARYRLELDGREHELEAFAVICANVGRIGRGGVRLAQDVDPTDGRMDVLAIRAADPASILAVGASILGLSSIEETADPDAPLHRWHAARARVTAEPAQEVQGDGDLLGETPVEVVLEPAAVRVVQP